MSKKHYGFTLAEVLLTLGIIGVVAAMTIPTVSHRMQAIKLRSQFMKSYSSLQQIGKLMQADGVTGDANEYPPLSRRSFHYTFRQYLKGATDCGNSGIDCYGKYLNTDYRRLAGRQYGGVTLRVSGMSFLQPDGSLVFIGNNYPLGTPITIMVDINGYKTPPNAAGYDLFWFQLMDNAEILPMGAPTTLYTEKDTYCNPKTNEAYSLNGISCACEAVKDPNYFKNLSWKFE